MTLSQRRTITAAVIVWALIVVSMVAHPVGGAGDGRTLILALIMLALPIAWGRGGDEQ